MTRTASGELPSSRTLPNSAKGRNQLFGTRPLLARFCCAPGGKPRRLSPKPSCSPFSAACWRISEHVQMVEALVSSANDACSGLMNGHLDGLSPGLNPGPNPNR